MSLFVEKWEVTVSVMISRHYPHLLADGFNGRLDCLSAAGSLVLNCLDSLQQRRHVRHHHLVTNTPHMMQKC